MSGPIDWIRAGFLIFAALFALSTYNTILNGNLEAGLTPGWMDFAVAHPMLFAFILIIGAVVIGGPFVAAMENA
jgi:hypothetical protein